MASSLELESIVAKPTWKEILLDLIDREKIDPWNIDLVEISDAFLKRVREMKRLDFVIEANVILAAAILLKHKSNYLKFLNYQSELTEFPADMENPGEFEPLDIPQLTLLSRIPPKRQITLQELIGEMDRAIEYETRERKPVRGSITDVVELALDQSDIEKIMEGVLVRIKKNTDSKGWSLFSKIVEKRNARDIVDTLLAVLHLTQNAVIDIRQDRMFGEIFIHLIQKKHT